MVVWRGREAVRTRKPSVEDGRRGHHAAAVAHMVNESIKRKGPVAFHWPIVLGPWIAPYWASYVGFPVASGYCVWAYWLCRK